MGYPKGAAHPKLISDRTTAMVLARLLDFYEVVLLPFGENQRYDLVVEDGDRFVRVQCKTGRLQKHGAIKFNTCSSTYHHPNAPTRYGNALDYRGQADYFGVYCSENGAVYIVPVHSVGRRSAFLRISPTLNSQRERVRWARDYILTPGGPPPFESEPGRGLEPLANGLQNHCSAN